MKKFLLNLLCLIIFGAQVCAQALILKMVLDLGILPDEYFKLFLIGMGAAALISFLLLFVLRNGPVLQTIRTLLAIVLAVAMVLGTVVANNMVGTLNKNLKQAAAATHPGSVVGIYVLKDDPAQSIADTAGYRYGYATDFDVNSSKEALYQVEQQLNSAVATTIYGPVLDAIDGLYAGEVGALVMNEVYVDVLEDSADAEDPANDYSDFESRVRLIGEIELEGEDVNENTAVVEVEPKKEIHVTSEPFVVYLSGSDTRTKMLTTSRSDVNILMVVNPVTKQILLLNTPRDYYVPISISESGAKDKLTHCGIYGINCSMDTLENLYGFDIDFYAQINFTGFEKLIDAVDGVTVYSEQSFTNGDMVIHEGYNDLNGEEALKFARERHKFADGDNQRGRNQMQVIKALIKKMTSGPTILQNYTQILDSLDGMFISDMQSAQIMELIKMQLSDGGDWDIRNYAVTGEGQNSTTFSMPRTTAYVMIPDEEMVSKASALVEKVKNGELLSDADLN